MLPNQHKCDAHSLEILAKTFSKNLVAQGSTKGDLVHVAALILDQALELFQEAEKTSPSLKVVSSKKS